MLRRATRRDVVRGSAEAAVVARSNLRAVLGSAARVFGRDPRPLSFGFGRRGFYGGAANARTPENRTLSADTRAKDCSLAASALHAASFIIFTLWQPFFWPNSSSRDTSAHSVIAHASHRSLPAVARNLTRCKATALCQRLQQAASCSAHTSRLQTTAPCCACCRRRKTRTATGCARPSHAPH